MQARILGGFPRDLLRLVLSRCSAKSLYAWTFCCRVIAGIILEPRYLNRAYDRLSAIDEEYLENYDDDDSPSYYTSRILPSGRELYFIAEGGSLTLEQTINGIMDGVQCEWEWDDEGGSWGLTSIERYKNDEPHGLHEEWMYDNGEKRLLCRCNYVEGKLEGPYEENRLDGVRIKCNYSAGGYDGLYERWHPNGNLAYRGRFSDGLYDGIHETWDGDGILVKREMWCQNKLVGNLRV